jgi:hypothetical protein
VHRCSLLQCLCAGVSLFEGGYVFNFGLLSSGWLYAGVLCYVWVVPKVAVLDRGGRYIERTSVQIKRSQSVLEFERVENQSFSVESRRTTSNQASPLWNLSE